MVKITPTKTGFMITRTPCVVCDEPPFGDEYCCGHEQPEEDSVSDRPHPIAQTVPRK